MDQLSVLNGACKLSGDDLRERLEALRRDFLPHVLRTEESKHGRVLEFDLSMKEQLEAVVAFEQQCCPDIHWSLRQEGERMIFEIPSGAEAFFSE